MILLAEDETRIGGPLKDMLCEAGFRVRYVTTSDEALETIDEYDAGLSALITDIQLGSEINGWDVARRARECQPDLPILYISGTCSEEHRSLGVPDSLMLRKPLMAQQVLRALQTLFDQRRLVAAA